MTLDAGSPLGVTLLVTLGIFAGFVNTLAGGGSFLTLPLLMVLGLPADIANGTNRLSVLCQSVAGALAFDGSGKLDRGAILGVVGPTLAGSLAGALVVSSIPGELLKPLLIASLLAIATLTVVKPNLFAGQVGDAIVAPRPAHRLGLFFIGMYGGFVQAGVGFLLLAYLGGVLRYDLVRGNALKIVAVAAFTAVAFVVFVARGQVAWLAGAVLAVGTVVGARLGVRFALSSGGRTLRFVLFAATVLACVGALLRK